MRYLVVVLTVAISWGIGAQEDSFLDASRNLLRYGIDSEVIELLGRLDDQGEDRLDEEILKRFEESRNRTLQAQILEYFERRDNGVAGSAVSEILKSDAELDNAFLRTAVRYVSRVAEIHSNDLLVRYEEIATGNDQVAASVAIGALGANGNEESVALLLELFNDLNGEELRGSVVRALGDTRSPDALETLERIVEDPFEDTSLRQYGAEALGKIADPGSETILLALQSDSNSLLRAYAIAALGNYDSPAAEQALEDALRDSFWRVRVAALQGIATRGSTDALDAVEYKARRDPEAPVRLEAVRTLAALESREAYDLLAKIADDPRASQADRLLAIDQLMENDLEANFDLFRTIIEQEWTVENSRVLDRTARGLSEARHGDLSGIFDRLLTHPNFIIQIYAIRGIGRNGFQDFGDRIISIAQDNPTGILNSTSLATLEMLGIEMPDEDSGDDELLTNETAPEGVDASPAD